MTDPKSRCAALMALLALVVVVVATPSPAAAQEPTARAPEQALDFMLGEWRTTGKLNDEAPPDRGQLTVARLFDGTGALGVMATSAQIPVDTADDSAFGLTHFESISMFVFHAETGTWRGMAHNSLANRKWIEVQVGDGELVLLHTGELFGGADGITRFTYHDITNDSYAIRVDFSTDGAQWQLGTYHMQVERIRP